MTTLITYDVEVDSKSNYVGILSNNQYQQLSFPDFANLMKSAKDSLFIGFNSNDYNGYDLPMVIAHYAIMNGKRLNISIKHITEAKVKLDNPDKYTDYNMVKFIAESKAGRIITLASVGKDNLARLLNSLFFLYPQIKPKGGMPVDAPPYTRLGLTKEVYTEIKKELVNAPHRTNKSYYFDVRDVFKSGSLKVLGYLYFKTKYEQTTDKTDANYNLKDLKTTLRLFSLKNCYEHCFSIIKAKEHLNFDMAALNASLLCYMYSSNKIGNVDAKKIAENNIRNIKELDESFGNKLEYLLKHKANIPHEVKLKNTTMQIPLTRGGIHWGLRHTHINDVKSKNKEGYYYYNIDFGSFYPSVYVENNLFGSKVTKELIELIEFRLSVKHTNKALATGLKLVLNTLYGMIGKQYALFVTAICQYLMIEFIIELDKLIGVNRVIDVNTDGIIVETTDKITEELMYLHTKYNGANDEAYISYTEKSRYNLEVTPLNHHIYYKDYNNYIIDNKFKGSWINSVATHHGAYMPGFGKILKSIIYGTTDELDKSDFTLVINGDKVDFLQDDLQYVYPTRIWNDQNGLCIPSCYLYSGLSSDDISYDITQETMNDIIRTITQSFLNADVTTNDKVYKSKALAESDEYIIPIKLNKKKKTISSYTFVDKLDINSLTEILSPSEFNELIRLAIESNKSKPKFFMHLLSNVIINSENNFIDADEYVIV